jgi:hypothetical protein
MTLGRGIRAHPVHTRRIITSVALIRAAAACVRLQVHLARADLAVIIDVVT